MDFFGFSASKPSAACDWISFAVGRLVSFHALLRPGEWGALAARQVAVPDRGIHGLSKHALITVLNAKNHRIVCRTQIAILDDPVAIGWIGWLSDTMPDDMRFAPGGAGTFRSFLFMRPQGHWKFQSWVFRRAASGPGEPLTCLPTRFLTLVA